MKRRRRSILDWIARRSGGLAFAVLRVVRRVSLSARVRRLTDGAHLPGWLPLLGDIDGRFFPPPVEVSFRGERSMSAPTLEITVDGRARAAVPDALVPVTELFPENQKFVFNVSFSCGSGERHGLYGDPQSIWFNVFFGYYQIDVLKADWERPFAYERVASGPPGAETFAVRPRELLALGSADWNYFSNFLYGVPPSALPTDLEGGIDLRQATVRGRASLAGGLWDRVDLDDIEVSSAYVVDEAELLARPHAALRALWRAAFGGHRARPEAFPTSFIRTRMKGRILMAWGEDDTDRDLHGPVYRTYIFGATCDQTYPDRMARVAEAASPGGLASDERRRIREHATRANDAFLDAQYTQIQRLIAREYAHLGFPDAPMAGGDAIGAPPPLRDETLETPDGEWLHLEHFVPRHGPARMVVVFVHGFSAYAAPYRHVAHALAGAQLAVTLYDARGHGHSTGRRGHVERFADYTDDLARVVARARALHPDVPLVLIGHSLGGAVVLDYLVADSTRAARPLPLCAAVAAPMLEIIVPVSPLMRALDATLGPLFPRIQVPNGIRGEMLTRNELVRQAYPRDPLIHHVATPRWFREARAAGARTLAAAPTLAVPTLFLTPGHDRIVSVEAQERFIAAAPAAEVTQHTYPALMHEIFLEPERGRVIADLVSWLSAAGARRPVPPVAVSPTLAPS